MEMAKINTSPNRTHIFPQSGIPKSGKREGEAEALSYF